MRLTRASSYALHAIVHLATQKEPGQPMASHLIAQARGIPERFLLKVLKPLVSARVLASIKGPNGGYKLAKSPNEVTLLDVVEAVDGPMRGIAPLSQDGSKDSLDRKLEAVCGETAEMARNAFQKVRISELASKDKGKR